MHRQGIVSYYLVQHLARPYIHTKNMGLKGTYHGYSIQKTKKFNIQKLIFHVEFEE